MASPATAVLSAQAQEAALYDAYIVKVIGLVFAASIALIGWEYIIFLLEEIQLHRKRKYNAATILLLIVRYSTLAAVGAAIPYVYGNPPSCRAAGYTISTTFWLMNSCVQAIFYLRTCAIWNWKPAVRWGVGALTILASGCWFAEIFTYGGSDDVPDIPYGGKCFQGQVQISWRALAYIASCVFDLVILLLTVGRLHNLNVTPANTMTRAGKTPTQLLVWQSVLYFFPVFITNLSGAILNLAASNPAVRAIATSYTFAISSVCAARLVFKMQDSFRAGGEASKSSHHSTADATLPTTSLSQFRNARGPTITQTISIQQSGPDHESHPLSRVDEKYRISPLLDQENPPPMPTLQRVDGMAAPPFSAGYLPTSPTRHPFANAAHEPAAQPGAFHFAARSPGRSSSMSSSSPDVDMLPKTF